MQQLENFIKNVWLYGINILRQIGRSYDRNKSDLVGLIGVVLLILFIIGAFAALMLFLICLGPLLLIWAVNTIAPVVGSTLVIPYSIPLMLAIAIVIWVLRSIFRRTVKVNLKDRT